MLPNFTIGGAQKSGTTFLHWALENHPAVFLPERPQEIHFFDIDSNWERGLPWLEAHFAGWNGQAAAGHTAPLYLYDPRVPERIHSVLPEMRFLFVLRHPVDRAYSHYWHEVRLGAETRPFEEALRLEPARIARDAEARRHFSYLDRGRYAVQLERFHRRFGAERVLVLRHDELREQPDEVRRRCAEFLRIDPGAFGPLRQDAESRNASMLPRSPSLQHLAFRLRPYVPRLERAIRRLNLREARYPRLDPERRRQLLHGFEDEIRALEKLTGIDFGDWLQPPGEAGPQGAGSRAR